VQKHHGADLGVKLLFGVDHVGSRAHVVNEDEDVAHQVK